MAKSEGCRRRQKTSAEKSGGGKKKCLVVQGSDWELQLRLLKGGVRPLGSKVKCICSFCFFFFFFLFFCLLNVFVIFFHSC